MTWGRDGTGGPTDGTAAHQNPHQGNTHSNGSRLRYAASRRMPPLGSCGCVRDPDRDRHRCGTRPLTDHQLHAWAHTAAHLTGHGLTPILPATVRAALYELAGGDA